MERRIKRGRPCKMEKKDGKKQMRGKSEYGINGGLGLTVNNHFTQCEGEVVKNGIMGCETGKMSEENEGGIGAVGSGGGEECVQSAQYGSECQWSFLSSPDSSSWGTQTGGYGTESEIPILDYFFKDLAGISFENDAIEKILGDEENKGNFLKL